MSYNYTLQLKEDDENKCTHCARKCSHCGSIRETGNDEDDDDEVVVDAYDSGNETRVNLGCSQRSYFIAQRLLLK